MLGDNVRKIRKLRGLTLEQLADKIESSSGTLSHIEKGTRNPSLDMLNKIADALGVPVQDLMAGDAQAENAYFDEINKMAFPGDNKTVSKHLDRDIKNTIAWGHAGVKEQARYDDFPLEDLQPVTVNFIKIPVLGRIPAGLPVEAKENIIDYVNVPENEVNNGYYFFLQVDGDSMINSGIKNGYRVLVKRQPDVESGEIAVVRVNNHDATLKRVKKIDGQVILYPDNPNYEPIFIKEEGAEIIGKVVKVEFDPNKKY
jgi:repressor LexA